jgi:4-hydroxy-tetrahydrodipicolinate synthase
MSAYELFRGVLAPMVTPFDESGAPERRRFVDHAKWLFGEGCTGLAPFGTTGEAVSLGLAERMNLLEALVEGGIDPNLLMPGTGLCSVTDSIELTRHAVQLNCGAVLMLPPFYYKAVNDEGLYRHFAEVIEKVNDERLRIFLYHIPPIAYVGISIDLIGRLVMSFPDIVVGLKDSSGDWANTKAVIDKFPDFMVFAGSEVFLLDTLRAGGAGCITAKANVNARAIREVYDQWQSDQADTLQANITASREAFQRFPMIPLLKGLLAKYHRDPVWRNVRPPLVEINMDDIEKVSAHLPKHLQAELAKA